MMPSEISSGLSVHSDFKLYLKSEANVSSLSLSASTTPTTICESSSEHSGGMARYYGTQVKNSNKNKYNQGLRSPTDQMFCQVSYHDGEGPFKTIRVIMKPTGMHLENAIAICKKTASLTFLGKFCARAQGHENKKSSCSSPDTELKESCLLRSPEQLDALLHHAVGTRELQVNCISPASTITLNNNNAGSTMTEVDGWRWQRNDMHDDEIMTRGGAPGGFVKRTTAYVKNSGQQILELRDSQILNDSWGKARGSEQRQQNISPRPVPIESVEITQKYPSGLSSTKESSQTCPAYDASSNHLTPPGLLPQRNSTYLQTASSDSTRDAPTHVHPNSNLICQHTSYLELNPAAASNQPVLGDSLRMSKLKHYHQRKHPDISSNDFHIFHTTSSLKNPPVPEVSGKHCLSGSYSQQSERTLSFQQAANTILDPGTKPPDTLVERKPIPRTSNPFAMTARVDSTSLSSAASSTDLEPQVELRPALNHGFTDIERTRTSICINPLEQCADQLHHSSCIPSGTSSDSRPDSSKILNIKADANLLNISTDHPTQHTYPIRQNGETFTFDSMKPVSWKAEEECSSLSSSINSPIEAPFATSKSNEEWISDPLGVTNGRHAASNAALVKASEASLVSISLPLAPFKKNIATVVSQKPQDQHDLISNTSNDIKSELHFTPSSNPNSGGLDVIDEANTKTTDTRRQNHLSSNNRQHASRSDVSIPTSSHLSYAPNQFPRTADRQTSGDVESLPVALFKNHKSRIRTFGTTGVSPRNEAVNTKFHNHITDGFPSTSASSIRQTHPLNDARDNTSLPPHPRLKEPQSKRASVAFLPTTSSSALPFVHRSPVNRRVTLTSNTTLPPHRRPPVVFVPSTSRDSQPMTRHMSSTQKFSGVTDGVPKAGVPRETKVKSMSSCSRSKGADPDPRHGANDTCRGAKIRGNVVSVRACMRPASVGTIAGASNGLVTHYRRSTGASSINYSSAGGSLSKNSRKRAASLVHYNVTARASDDDTDSASVVDVSGSSPGDTYPSHEMIAVERSGPQLQRETRAARAHEFDKSVRHCAINPELPLINRTEEATINVNAVCAKDENSKQMFGNHGVSTSHTSVAPRLSNVKNEVNERNPQCQSDPRMLGFSERKNHSDGSEERIQPDSVSPKIEVVAMGRCSMDSTMRRVVFADNGKSIDIQEVSNTDDNGDHNDDVRRGNQSIQTMHMVERVSCKQGRPERMPPMRRMVSFRADRRTVSLTNDDDIRDRDVNSYCNREAHSQGDLLHNYSIRCTRFSQSPSSYINVSPSSESSTRKARNRRAVSVISGRERARVTVPKPFCLSGEALQEQTKAAIEDARRKKAEIETRRRAFRARPMPDFSRPYPMPKGTL